MDGKIAAADHPFEDVADGAGWFDAAPISEHDREKIGRLNVKRLLAL
jgi:predicted TIM-barrel fold metal-dependent hydrolase